MEVRKSRNWAELPPELISEILVRLKTIDILDTAQKVCRSWRRVCKDTSMWRKITMKYMGSKYRNHNLEIMCRHAVDRSQGGLVKIKLWWMGSDHLFNYIAHSSVNLKSFSFVESNRITEQGFVAAIVKLPLLEEVEMQNCSFSSESLRVVGHSCPNLKILKLRRNYRFWEKKNDDDAVAIAETMPGLHHLQLIANRLSNTGLNFILDNCPNLEHLDIRVCPEVKLVGNLQKRCYDRIKVVKHPKYGILRK